MKWLVAGAVLTVGSHFALLLALPTLINERTLSDLEATGYEVNRVYYGGVKDAPDDIVPYDNAHNMSSFLVFDVSQAPVRIVAPVPRGVPYWSLALYSSNTDNFFLVNDLQIHGAAAEVVIVPEDCEYSAETGVLVARSPSPRGVGLIRMLLRSRGDSAHVDSLRGAQRAARAELVPGACGERRVDS